MERLVRLVTTTSLSYNEEGKETFHRLGRNVLKIVAFGMQLAPGSYEIRSNKGGIAVSGEVTLHGEHIYIQLGDGIDFGGAGKRFMYRYCKHNRDYTGGINRWMSYTKLWLDFEGMVREFKLTERNGI